MKNQKSTGFALVFRVFAFFSGAILLLGCEPSEPPPLKATEESTFVRFSSTTLSLAENSTSEIVVQLSLSKPAIEDRVLMLVVTDYYTNTNSREMVGSVYSTKPEVVADDDYGSTYILLAVQKDAKQIEFTVSAVDNKIVNNYNSKLVFQLFDNRDYKAINTWTITIEDDE
jgi:hypothetical protein